MQRHNSLISAESRILLHLLFHHSSITQFDISIELTQIGIAQKTDISRGYLSRPLKSLKEKGYIQERVGHVDYANRRCRYYILTERGKGHVSKIKKELSYLPITVRLLDDTTKVMNFNNIITYLSTKENRLGITEMDILTSLTKDGVLNINSLKKV